MIKIKSAHEVEQMRVAGRITAETFEDINVGEAIGYIETAE